MRTQGRSGGGGRKMPHTVTGQFQMSLQALMETLNRANPYFIRCIKSNANKVSKQIFFFISLFQEIIFFTLLLL